MGERKLLAPAFLNKTRDIGELKRDMEEERIEFDRQKEELIKKIHEIDQEWDVMREVQAQTQSKVKEKLKLLTQNLEALESSNQAAVTSQPLDEDIELAEEKRDILRDLNDLNESSEKIQTTVKIVEDQISTLEFLARSIPNDNKEIVAIINRQLLFRMDKETRVFRLKNEEAISKLKSLEEELDLLSTLSHGLRSENQTLQRKIASGKAFKQQLLSSFQTLTQTGSEMEGVQQSELDKVTQQMQESLKQELRQLKHDYEKQISRLDPSPRALIEEIQSKESVTEILNNKLNELVAELDAVKETGRRQIAKLQKSHSDQLSDMILRAEIRRKQSSDSSELTQGF